MSVWNNPELSNYHFPEFFFSDLSTFLQSKNSASRVWPDCAFTENGKRKIWKNANHFCLVDGTLHYIHQKSKKNLLVIKYSVKDAILFLTACHTAPVSGHLGINKTVTKVMDRYYWPGPQHNDFKEFIGKSF